MKRGILEVNPGKKHQTVTVKNIRQIKICSCETNDVEQLQHYKLLSRPGGQISHLVGETLLPANIDEQLDQMKEISS